MLQLLSSVIWCIVADEPSLGQKHSMENYHKMNSKLKKKTNAIDEDTDNDTKMDEAKENNDVNTPLLRLLDCGNKNPQFWQPISKTNMDKLKSIITDYLKPVQ